MTLIAPRDAVGLVSSITRLPPVESADWIRKRASLGAIEARARSEEWIRPVLTEDCEFAALADHLETFGGYEVLAHLELALAITPDLTDAGVPIVWGPVVNIDVKIDPRFWASRTPEDPLWDGGIFLGRFEALPEFRYDLIGIEFNRANLENSLEPFRPRPIPIFGIMPPALPAAPTGTATPPRVRTGKFDVEAFVRQALERLKDEGGIGPAFTKANLQAALELWCDERWGKTPSRAWMYSHFPEAEQRYQAYLSSLA